MRSIQCLRGVAVLSVVCFHSWALGWVENLPLFRYGHWGVQLFFMISGFIMVQKLPTYRNFLHFGRRRMLRLWPPVLISIALSVPFAFLAAGDSKYQEITFTNYITSLFMLNPMLLNGILGTQINYPFQILWTLSVEISFYLVISAIYFFVGRRRIFVVIGILTISTFSAVLYLSEWQLFYLRSLSLLLSVVFTFPSSYSEWLQDWVSLSVSGNMVTLQLQ